MKEEKLFRAIVIDPAVKMIGEVRTDASLQSIYSLIGADPITTVRLGRHDWLFLDDEGFLKAGVPVFRMKNYPLPLAGRGLILGADDAGESVSTTMELEAVARFVQWTDEESTGSLTPGYDIPGGVHIGDPITRKRTTTTN